MAKTIRGLSIEISGNTTKLQDALKKVNETTRGLNKELGSINNALKFDPKNTELLAQKQSALSESIENTSEKLKILKKAQEEASKSFVNGEMTSEEFRKINREVEVTERQLKSLNKELDNVNKIDFKQLGEKFKDVGEKIKNVGGTLTKFVTVPLVGAFGLATKSAIDFESAFTGVAKTVDATDEELNQLKTDIRDMAKEMPASTTEISRVAEAAGQLGIKTENIKSFTKTMIDLGETTNLSSDEAADALARLANITGMSQKDFDKLGATIVELGNNGASTEKDITQMALRLAGAGKTVGMTEANIVAFANALSSVGIEAEMGGSAFSKMMIEIEMAVAKNSPILKDYAKLSGMSAKEFAAAWEKDAAGAMTKFLEGLGNVEKNGGNLITTLDDLGITEVRLRDTMLRASNASNLFGESVKMGNNAWEKNSALTKEAEKRYGTFDSQLKITKNKLNDLAITMGDKLLPYAIKMLDKVKDAINWFANLDNGTKGLIITISGIAMAIGPVISVIGNLTVAFGALTAATGIFGGIALAIGGVVAALNIMSIVNKNSKDELLDLSETFKSTEDVISEVDKKFSDIEKNSREKFSSISKSFMQTLTELTSGVEKSELQSKWQNLLNQLTSTLDVHKQEIIDKYELIKKAIEETYEGDERINKIAEVNKLEEGELGNLQDIYDKHLKKIIEITGTNGENIDGLSSEQTAKIRSHYKDMVDELGNYGSEIDMTNTATAFSEETQKIIDSINEKLKSGQQLTKEEIEEYKKAMTNEVDAMIKEIDEKIKNQELLAKKGIISEEASKNTIEELEKIKNDTKNKLVKDIDYLINEVPTLIDNSNGWLKFKNIKNPWEFLFGFSEERKDKASKEAKKGLENFADSLGKGVSDNKAKWENAGGEVVKYFNSNVVGGMTSAGENAYGGFALGSPDWKYSNLGKSNAKAYNKAFDKEMDIHSPSKKAEKSGNYILEGFLKSNNAKKYLEQGLKNAKAYTNAFQDNLNKYVTVNQNLKGMTPEPDKRFNFTVGTLINNTDKDTEALVNDMDFMIKRGDLK